MERTVQKERIRKLETAKGRKERERKKRGGGKEAKSAKGNGVLETENGERRTRECKGETDEKEKSERQRDR